MADPTLPPASAEGPTGSPATAPRDNGDYGETERLIYFSDAVLAIALTLLAINLPLPAQGTNTEMLREARHDWPEYLAFLISFAVISAHWRLHHQLFRHIERASPALVRLNLNWLLLAVVTPFLTRLLSVGSVNLVRFVPYTLAQACQFTLFAVMIAVVRRQGLLQAPADLPVVQAFAQRAIVFAVTFAVSIPAFAIIGGRAFALWGVLPLLGRLVRWRQRRRPPTTPERTWTPPAEVPPA